MQMTEIAGGDGVPNEPDWSSIYAEEFDIAAAHEGWSIVIRELRSSVTLTVAGGDAIRRLVEFRV